MAKERIFQKKLTIANFKTVKASALAQAGRTNVGKTVREVAEMIAEVYYTPRGYRIEVHAISPVPLWDESQMVRLEGCSDECPEGDLVEKNFESQLAAMHFITRRFKKLGWDPVGKWLDG